MNIKAQTVKELRQRTDAGIMECKQALIETNGDLEKAIIQMRKLGQAKADKTSSRPTAEGVVAIARSNNKLTMIEVNSETDFAARSNFFRSFVKLVVHKLLSSNVTKISEVLQLKLADNESLDVARKNLIAKLGENVTLRRIASIQNNQLGGYVHSGRIGVIVSIKSKNYKLDLAKDVAMHIAASNPLVISQQQVPNYLIEREKEVLIAQALQTGKDPRVIDKIISGKIRKFLDKHSLLGQAFIKNPKQTINELLKQHDATVIKFFRFSVGEGIETNETDFANDVIDRLKK